MKSVVLIVLFSMVMTSFLVAQEDSAKTLTRHVYVWGGSSYPYLPALTKDVWKTGWNAGVGYGYSFSPGPIGYGELFGTVEFSRFAFNETGYRSWLLPQYSSSSSSEIQTGGLTARGAISNLTVFANFKGTFSTSKHSIAPYFLIGVGYMHYSQDSIAIQDTLYAIHAESKSSFAWSVGIGIEAPITDEITFFVQGKSVLGVFQEERQYFPLSGGFRIQF